MTFVSARNEQQLMDLLTRGVKTLEKFVDTPEKDPIDVPPHEKLLNYGGSKPLPLELTSEEVATLQEARERVQYVLKQVDKASRHLIDDRDRMKTPTKIGQAGEPLIPRDSRLYFETVVRIEVLENIGSHLRYALGMNDENPRFV